VLGGIDCDPASNAHAQAWIQAATWVDWMQDGLAQPWHGRVWLNPPYGAEIGQWIDRLMHDYQQQKIDSAILLVRPAAGSAWYTRLASRFARCEASSRIRFVDCHGHAWKSPVHGNVFFYLGEDVARFHAVFAPHGAITVPFTLTLLSPQDKPL
jgi:DNA N-6-adenine-methyltransferase (Dam)